MKTALFSFSACLALSCTLRAQQSAVLSPIPAGNAIHGSYACMGTFRSGKTHRAHFQAELALEGKWLRLTEQDIEPATGYRAEYLIGYDAITKQIVEFDANNFGAATYTSSTGWTANTLTATSPVSAAPPAPYAANRFVYTLLPGNAFSVDWQVSRTADLQWITSDHLLCTSGSK